MLLEIKSHTSMITKEKIKNDSKTKIIVRITNTEVENAPSQSNQIRQAVGDGNFEPSRLA